MRALVSSVPGGGATLDIAELPTPEAKIGEVKVRTHFAGINYPDVLIIDDRYQIRPERPFSPGIEIAGVVDAIGPDVEGIKVGDPCVALLRYGGLAEYAVAPSDAVAPVPEGLDPTAAAAMIVSYGTSWHALHDRARLQRGETLLVLGASGVVGLAAVQLGKAMGARVVAAVSSPDKTRAAEANGADQVVLYPADDVDPRGLATMFREACGKGGANCIFDPVGGLYGEAAIRALAWQGRYLVVGFAAAMPNVPANVVLLKSADVLGVTWGETVAQTPGMFRRHMAEIGDMAARGVVAPRPTLIVSLEEAVDAIEALEARRAFGKTIVRIAEA